VHWTPAFVAMLGYNIVLVTAIGWLIWIYILASLPAGTAGLSVLAIPLIGLVSSRWQLGEGASQGELAGMALIVASLLVLAWRNRRG
jgi:drug/metabolite transporter (DMT)-like permease